MKTCILVKPGRIEIADVKKPSPKAGEILLRVKAALTCGTDLKAFLRGHPVIPMPGPFGHEFSGTVEAVGKGVAKFRPGDDIMAVHSAPCLKCRYCKKSLYNLCENIMETKVLGAFSEYILIPPHIVKQNVYPKPKSLSFAEAALLEPLSCVVHGLRPLNIKRGDTALVIGAGPIGLMHVMLLRRLGAKTALVDANPQRLAGAKAFGASAIGRPEDIENLMKKATKCMGFDYAFECTGRREVWESSPWHVRRGGTVTLFGGLKSGEKAEFDAGRLHYDEITLRGVFHFAPEDVKEARRLMASGKLPLKKFISGSCRLSGISSAFDKLRKGEGVKYAVLP